MRIHFIKCEREVAMHCPFRRCNLQLPAGATSSHVWQLTTHQHCIVCIFCTYHFHHAECAHSAHICIISSISKAGLHSHPFKEQMESLSLADHIGKDVYHLLKESFHHCCQSLQIHYMKTKTKMTTTLLIRWHKIQTSQWPKTWLCGSHTTRSGSRKC